MRRRAAVVIVASMVSLPITGMAHASPRVLKGWPIVAPAGVVHQGPAGGAVITPARGTFARGAVAFSLDGTRLWATVEKALGSCRPPGCGADPRRNADGTYGPFGGDFLGDNNFWSVDQSGRRVDGCTGVVDVDATCISGLLRPSPGAAVPPPDQPFDVTALRGGVTLWTYTEPGRSFGSFGVPYSVVADNSNVYAIGGPITSGAGGFQLDTVALDARTGSLRWRLTNALAIAGLGEGLIAIRDNDIVAYAGDGQERWRRPGSPVRIVLVDPVAGRVYVEQSDVAAYGQSRQVVALDAATGRQLWSSPADTMSKLVSIDGRGNVIVANRAPACPTQNGAACRIVGDQFSVAALGSAGAEVWRRETATEVVGARELAGGTVAVSLRGPDPVNWNALLLRFDPRQSDPEITRPRLALSRYVVRPACGGITCDGARQSAILTIRLRSRATMTVTMVRRRSGNPLAKHIYPSVRFVAPEGTSWVRLLERASVPKGRYFVRVRWRDNVGGHQQRLPLRVM